MIVVQLFFGHFRIIECRKGFHQSANRYVHLIHEYLLVNGPDDRGVVSGFDSFRNSQTLFDAISLVNIIQFLFTFGSAKLNHPVCSK